MNLKYVISALAASLVLSACSKNPESDLPKDQWSKGTWVVQRADGAGKSVLEKPGAKNEFRLVPKGKAGKIIYYEVKVEGNDMPDEWKGAILFPRGTAEPLEWPAAMKLDPWNPDLTGPDMDAQALAWKTTIDTVRDQIVNTSIKRLEGDVLVKEVAEALRLVIVHDAIKGPESELLLVNLFDTRPSGVQDGSGHGVHH